MVVLSGGFFDGARDVKLEGARPREGDTLGIPELTGVDIKLGIYDGEVMDNTLGDVDVF